MRRLISLAAPQQRLDLDTKIVFGLPADRESCRHQRVSFAVLCIRRCHRICQSQVSAGLLSRTPPRHHWHLVINLARAYRSADGGGRALTGSGALTWNGRRYSLGRRFAFADLAGEGEEAVLSHRFQGERSDVLNDAVDRLWVSSCRMARHLGVPAPARDRAAVTAFMNGHLMPFSKRLPGRAVRGDLRGSRGWRPAALRKMG